MFKNFMKEYGGLILALLFIIIIAYASCVTTAGDNAVEHNSFDRAY